MPWTGFWGAQAQELATERGTSLWSLDPGAVSEPTSRLDESLPHSRATDVPWALGVSEVPASTRDGGGAVADLDTAIARADREGLRHPFTVALPAAGTSESGVCSVIGYASDAPSDERTLHVDRYDGEVVVAHGFDDYPALAKVVAQGIGLHEGRMLGPLLPLFGLSLLAVLVLAQVALRRVPALSRWFATS